MKIVINVPNEEILDKGKEMKVKAKKVKERFLIPLKDELKDKEEIVVEIKEEPSTEFLDFLKKVYGGKENLSKITNEGALEDALEKKYKF